MIWWLKCFGKNGTPNQIQILGLGGTLGSTHQYHFFSSWGNCGPERLTSLVQGHTVRGVREGRRSRMSPDSQLSVLLQDQRAHGIFSSFTISASEFTLWPDGAFNCLYFGQVVGVAFSKSEFPGKDVAYMAEQYIDTLIHFNTKQAATGLSVLF